MTHRYISEIDSLRALAVLLVIGFHAVPEHVPGGYIGVDIFFVISGFVISAVYLFPLLNHEKTIAQFYLARLRRLVPALLAVLLVATIAAYVLLYPDHLIPYGWSLASQILYLQNMVFWVEGDYFESAISKPLLHTWTLAVEAQFYLIASFAVLLARRFPRIILVLAIMALVLSLVIGFWLEPRSPKTVFFLIATRIWEFGLGVGAFLVLRYVPKYSDWVYHLVAAVCVAVMIYTGFAYSSADPFPGAQSILACLACALCMICFAQQASANRLFNFAPVSYTGKISYGLYLWHWPPLAFFFLAQEQEPNLSFILMVVVASFGAAVLSYHLLETPIRAKRWLPNTKQFLVVIGFGFGALSAFGLFLATYYDPLDRYPEMVRPYFKASLEKNDYRCPKSYVLSHPTHEICPRNGVETGAGILMIGDSHIDFMDHTIARIAEDTSRPAYLAVRNCTIGQYGDDDFCTDAVRAAIADQSREKGITDIIAVSFWKVKLEPLNKLQEDVAYFTSRGIRLHFIDSPPIDSSYDPKDRAIAALETGMLNRDGIRRAAYEIAQQDQIARFTALTEQFPDVVFYHPLADFFCDERQCRYEEEGVPYYVDSHHLSQKGIVRIEPLLRDIIAR